MPGIFSIRDGKTRQNLIKDMIEMILDLDLRLVYKTSMPYSQILNYCNVIANHHSEILRPSTLKKQIKIPEAAQLKLLHALESVFLIRKIPVEGDYQGNLYWFEDQIEEKYFSKNKVDPTLAWVSAVYRNLRAQFNYRVGEDVTYFSYQTRGGARMPIGIRSQDRVLGVFPIEKKSDVSRSLKRSADSFLKSYNSSLVVFVTKAGNEIEIINDRTAIVPTQVCLF